ncbi:MAG: hypothetical protein HY064_03425 [Bacteroidetes bacterium]|nr:hypothetical protein [Bacteroidota bacterium]
MNYGTQQPPSPENKSKTIWKVLRVQLTIFAAYQILIGFLSIGSGTYDILFKDMAPLLIHELVLLILMILSFSKKQEGAGYGYLLSLIIVMVVGFGSCCYLSSVLSQ